MPKLKWAGFEDVNIAAAQVGPRIRALREARKLSIRGLSERAGVSKTTILRLEQGLPIAEKIFLRICDCLQTLPLNLLVSDEPSSTPYRLQRKADGPWRIAFRREKSPAHFKGLLKFASFPLSDTSIFYVRSGFSSGSDVHDAGS